MVGGSGGDGGGGGDGGVVGGGVHATPVYSAVTSACERAREKNRKSLIKPTQFGSVLYELLPRPDTYVHVLDGTVGVPVTGCWTPLM